MLRIVSVSGGIASWAAGMRVAEQQGTDDLLLAFTDTLIEDRDLYRFLLEGTAAILGDDLSEYEPGLEAVDEIPDVRLDSIDDRKSALARVRALQPSDRLVWLCDGRTPVEVFFDVGFLGNTRADPCSRVLKRDLYRTWLEENATPEESVTYLGLDWTEIHRSERFAENWKPWQVEAPLCEPPYLTRDDYFKMAEEHGIEPPRLYSEGFGHNNCSGGCVKAGHGQWALVLRQRPEVYAYWEEAEQRFREETGHDVSILRDRRDIGDGGAVKPLTLTQLRERVACGDQIDMLDQGGCGCFVDLEAA